MEIRCDHFVLKSVMSDLEAANMHMSSKWRLSLCARSIMCLPAAPGDSKTIGMTSVFSMPSVMPCYIFHFT